MARRPNKQQAARDFFRRIATDGAYAPIFALFGDEDFLVREARQRISDAALGDDTDGLNRDLFDGKDADPSKIASAANALPMFAPMRLVEVRNAHKLNADAMNILAKYAESPSETTVLVLVADSFDRRKKATKTLLGSSNCEAIELAPLRDAEAGNWVKRQAGRYNLRLANDVPGLMVEVLGTSLQKLDNALERLDLFIGPAEQEGAPRGVRRDVVESLIVDTRTRAWFELTDALLERRVHDAIRIYRQAVLYGEAAIPTVSRIGFQFRTVLLMQAGSRRGLHGRDLTDFADCRSFLAQKFLGAARRWNERELRFVIQRIAETDDALKSSKLGDTLLVERLFLDMADAANLSAR